MEPTIFVLSIIFLILLFVVCGAKAFRLLLSLGLAGAAILFVITPLIVAGYSPELVILFTGIPLVACVVYLTEGFTTLSHLSLASVVVNFLFVSLLTHAAVNLAGLTGLVSNDDSFLGLAGVDLRALLVAGIMLGTLGILTEMIVTQTATVLEFAANPAAGREEVFHQSYSVGVAHLGSIINTLFLVYAGVSFPLLIVYVGGGGTLGSALNYEPLVSDILRTLCGTVGLILAMPLSTLLTVWWLKRRVRRA